MKLLIDENIPPLITSGLRSLGYDVKSAKESCRGCSDEQLVEIAKNEERIIITYDLDFGELYHHLGIGSIVLRLRTKEPSSVLKHLQFFLKTITDQEADIGKKLAILKEGRIRIIG